MIRILVVDDHTLVRDGLCRIVGNEADMEVIGEAGTAREALDLCKREKPDVVILDYNLPDLDGLETTGRILALGLGTKILILTMYANEEYAIRLIQAGASGFVIKVAPSDELLSAIRKVRQGGVFISSSVLEKMVGRIGQPGDTPPEAVLSNREMQVLVRLARGETTKEVGQGLALSLSTVETYRARILEKLGLRNNSDLTRFAIKQRLIDLD